MILPKSFIATANTKEIQIEIPDEWIGKRIEVIIDEINATVLLRKLNDIQTIESNKTNEKDF